MIAFLAIEPQRDQSAAGIEQSETWSALPLLLMPPPDDEKPSTTYAAISAGTPARDAVSAARRLLAELHQFCPLSLAKMSTLPLRASDQATYGLAPSTAKLGTVAAPLKSVRRIHPHRSLANLGENLLLFCFVLRVNEA